MSDKKNPGIAVTFSLVAGEPGDIVERAAFWDAPSTVQWFRDQGYILYQRGEPEVDDLPSPYTFPPHSPTQASIADYPYPHYDLSHTLCSREPKGKVVFALNSLNQHVAIKLVKADTDELTILQFLKMLDLNVLRDNCVIPVLDILPIEGFSFVVMPRFFNQMGDRRALPKSRDITRAANLDSLSNQSMYHMAQETNFLKAVNFLHEHNITHRDIKLSNFLVNHCVHDDYTIESTHRKELRSQNRLLYAIFDFDHSIKLPPGVDRSQFRLPYKKSWGTFNVVNDTAQGEPDFNPFVFDVAELDQEILLERDVAWHIPYDTYDRWENLPPEFIRQWEHYREPPLRWTTTLLRKICLQPWGWHTVPQIRRLLACISSPFRHKQ
ncbi:hypothetical protein JR316_0006821 [Psilocybe cubensis]|uniref:Uncharacterized protein n=1 Tax=Psilocybe cubensis TaxID=181762 RepID=A0ACB8GXG9_PSICU|nr:hypothetical protein JR316_0006821 [Psilocybe cubensis]KAH9480223.1 hypothetical protein JR316_0006821 [Psilocybe cubensis]